MTKILLIALSLISLSAFGQNTRIPDFNNAKKILKKTQYLGVEREVYCNCKVLPNNKFDNSSCGYKAKKDNERSRRLEAEHVVPFSSILGDSQAWDNGDPSCKGKKGRACAGKIYGYIEGDLWNLLPSIGELNGQRSNYSPTEISGEAREYGTCDFEISDRKVEPPEDMKPVMAAAYYYIQDAYGKSVGANVISGKNEKLLQVWYNRPMPKWACDWASRVRSIQGNDNKFMSAKCK